MKQTSTKRKKLAQRKEKMKEKEDKNNQLVNDIILYLA